MMWNFLVSGLLTRAAIVLYDGNPGHPDMSVLWDLAARAGVTMFGTSASYIAACMKAGVEPGAGRDLSRLERGRLDRLPALPRGLRLDLRAARRRHLALLDQRRHRPLHRLRRRHAAAAGLPRRAAGARARRRGRGLGRRRQPGDRRGRRARRHRADALDAGLLLGRSRRQPLPGQLLRALPGRLAPRRLDRNHRPRHRRHLRPLRLDHQPLRHPHGDERDLPRGARRRRDRRRPRRRHPPPRHRGLDAALRRPPRGRRAGRRAAPRDRQARAPNAAPPATSPTRSSRSPRCRARSAARCSRCRSSGS